MIINKIRGIRVELDAIAQVISKDLGKSRELSLAYTAIQLSKMWLGITLKSLGNGNPYPESKNPISLVIEKTADTSEKENYLPDMISNENGEHIPMNIIQKVKWVREKLEKIEEDDLKEIRFESQTKSADRATEYLIECSMWLGQQLSNLM